MKYFPIPYIKAAIEHLQDINANWLLPAFVFAANNVGTDNLVDLSQSLGTDSFLDRYFNGSRLGIPAFPTGKNLLRPRLKGIKWNRGVFADDYMLRQNTKMWGNLFSSRGYREMRMRGFIEGDQAINRLTDSFQGRFEEEVPATFRFEDFLVWLFAFEGFSDDIDSWEALYRKLLDDLGLAEFKLPYQGRFSLSQPPVPWPEITAQRPTNEEFIEQLSPKLAALLATGEAAKPETGDSTTFPPISSDDVIYTAVETAIMAEESLAFLFAGPPGTGKTRYARRLAAKITDGDADRMLFLQFHPALGYDDFIEGFRPTRDDKSESGIKYELAPRLFLKFAREAAKAPEKSFVAVIDELNRGDIARIFGEVLTYLEPAYRNTAFTLSFSGEPGMLPSNLIVLATANPYDRSVTDLDDALLRRFWVVELEPDGAVLRSHLQDEKVDESVIKRALHLFNIVNKQMPHGFGHTNFLNVRSIEDLALVWTGRVRMALRRSLMHDKAAFEAAEGEIEGLLSTRNDDQAQEATQGGA